MPLCNSCINIKTKSSSIKGTELDDEDCINNNLDWNREAETNANLGEGKKLLWHDTECQLLKKNSVRVSLEGKDEKEASKVIPAGEKIPLCIITNLYPFM